MTVGELKKMWEQRMEEVPKAKWWLAFGLRMWQPLATVLWEAADTRDAVSV